MKSKVALFIAAVSVFIISGLSLARMDGDGSSLVKCGIALDREAFPAGSSQKAVMKISLNAPEISVERERPPVNLALVIDKSGSMTGDKIEKAKQAAIESLRRLTGNDVFSVITYDTEVKTLIPAQKAGRTENVEALIRSISANGNTALFGAVSQGAAEVRKNITRPYVHRIILLSDGLANVGPSAPADLGRLGAALLKEGISVTTMGVGSAFNEDLMTLLAEKSDGNHYFVESGADLPHIFAAELGDVLSVAARKIVIEIECPDGVRPIQILGREGRIKNSRVEVYMNQLYGGQEKYVLVEVQMPSSLPGQRLEIANVACSYENALTDRSETSRGSAFARFTKSSGESIATVNKEVQSDWTNNYMAVTRDQALDLYNAGKEKDAAEELRKRSQEIQEKNKALGLDDLAQEAQVLEEEAGDFEKKGLDSNRKKSIRSGSYIIRQQQKSY